MIEVLLTIICILLLLIILIARQINSSVSQLSNDVQKNLVREAMEQSFKLNKIEEKILSQAHLNEDQMEQLLEYISNIREVAITHRRQHQISPGDRELLDEIDKNS